MNANIQRALLLFDQSRHDLAEAELRQALAAEPDEPMAHALLGLCLAEREQFKEATQEAEQAVHLAPDLPFAHYALASILHHRNRNEEALPAVLEAIRLDTSAADYFALLSAIHLDERRWPAALEAAEQGLRLDAEHVSCSNFRAIALVKLGRRDEAGATIDATLAKRPEDSNTHANQGWTLLHQGNPKKALEHFREALRLNPGNEWARRGIVEALKARNIVYALVLRYFLWMSRLSSRAQWGVVICGYLGNRLLGAMAAGKPKLAPWVLPLQIAYVAFALFTWLADPLFNLLLRLNRFGRLVLSREQTVASNWIGACMLLALGSLAGFIFGRSHLLWLLCLIVFGFLLLPLAGTFKCHKGWPRKAMAMYTGAMAVTGFAACMVLQSLDSHGGTLAAEHAGKTLLNLFLLGAIGSAWVANILISQRPRR